MAWKSGRNANVAVAGKTGHTLRVRAYYGNTAGWVPPAGRAQKCIISFNGAQRKVFHRPSNASETNWTTDYVTVGGLSGSTRYNITAAFYDEWNNHIIQKTAYEYTSASASIRASIGSGRVLDATVSYSGDVLARSAQIRVNGSLSDTIYSPNSQGIAPWSFSKTDLSRSANYGNNTVEVRFLNSSGQLVESATSTIFVPEPVPPPSAVSNLRSIDITDTTVGFAWNYTGDTSRLKHFQVGFGENRLGLVYHYTNGREEAFTRLVPNRSYIIQVRAINNDGQTGPWRAITIKTLPSPLEPPRNLRATSITENSIVVAWSSVNLASGYIIGINEIGGNYSEYLNTSRTSITFRGLKENTSYIISASSVNQNNISGESEASIVVTTKFKPLISPTINVEVLNATTARVTASSTQVNIFNFQWKLSNSSSWQVRSRQTNSIQTFYDLQRNSSYDFRIEINRTNGGVYESEYSRVITINLGDFSPRDWEWRFSKSAGSSIYDVDSANKRLYVLPASEWNDFLASVEANWRYYHGTNKSYSRVSRNTTFTAARINTVIRDLNSMTTSRYQIAEVRSGDKVGANLFADLRAAVNSI